MVCFLDPCFRRVWQTQSGKSAAFTFTTPGNMFVRRGEPVIGPGKGWRQTLTDRCNFSRRHTRQGPKATPCWQRSCNHGAIEPTMMPTSLLLSVFILVTAGIGMAQPVFPVKVSPNQRYYVAASAATDGSFLVAYLPPERTGGGVFLDLGALNSAAYGYWFDPTDGTFTLISENPFDNHGPLTFHPPGKNSANANDWVLLLSTNKVRAERLP